MLAVLLVFFAVEGPLLFLLTVATAVARREYFFWMPTPALAYPFLVVILLWVVVLTLARALFLFDVRLLLGN